MDKSKLSGAEKAAILLLALGEDISGEMFKHLSETEAKRIAAAISRLGRIEQSLIDTVMNEFQDVLARAGTVKRVVGGPESALALLKHVKNFDAATFAKQLGLDAPPSYESLERADAKLLSRILVNEHPQTVAAVLAQLDAKKFGETLKLLPAAQHVDLILRVARLERIDPEAMQAIDEAINSELEKASLSGSTKRLGGAAAVAAMLASLDSSGSGRRTDESGKAKDLLRAIAERHPELAGQIEELLFVFEDLRKLDGPAIQRLLAQIPSKTLTLALKGASEPLKQHIFTNMSPRAAERLRDDIESLQRVRRSDAEAAQQEIAKLAKSLIDKGEIELPGSADQYV